MARNKYEDDDELYEAPASKAQNSGWSQSTPSTQEHSQKSMEEEKLQESLRLLEDVQKVLEKTLDLKGEAASMIKKVGDDMGVMIEVFRKFHEESSSYRENGMTIDFRISDETKKAISHEFTITCEKAVSDTKKQLTDISQEIKKSLADESAAIVEDAQKRIDKIKKENDEFSEKQKEGDGLYLGRVGFLTGTYLLFVVISGYCASFYAVSVIQKEGELSDWISWWMFCLVSPVIFWVLRFIWRKWL